MRWPQRKWTLIWGPVRSLTLCRWGRRGGHILLRQRHSALEVIWEGNGEGRFCRWVEGVGHFCTCCTHPLLTHGTDCVQALPLFVTKGCKIAMCGGVQGGSTPTSLWEQEGPPRGAGISGERRPGGRREQKHRGAPEK